MRELLPMAPGLKSLILNLIWQMTSCCMMPSMVECLVWAENAEKVNAKCGYKHAPGVCKTCSFGLDTDDPQIVWIYYPGMHGRSCYCKHLNVMLA